VFNVGNRSISFPFPANDEFVLQWSYMKREKVVWAIFVPQASHVTADRWKISMHESLNAHVPATRGNETNK